jgi:hypothetical protein
MALLGKSPAQRRKPRRGPLFALPLTIQYAVLGGFILGICLLLLSLQPRVASLLTPPTITLTPAPPTDAPTATATIPPRPTDLPSPTFTATPPPPTVTGTPPPSPTPGIGPGATVEVGGTGGQGLVMHTDAGLNTAVVRVIREGERVTVVAGPEQADDLVWWQVRDANGQEGWVVESYLTLVTLP